MFSGKVTLLVAPRDFTTLIVQVAMRRRTYLAGVVAGVVTLPGCTVVGRDPTQESHPPRGLESLSTSDISYPGLSIAGSIMQSDINPDKTAKFKLEVEWNGEGKRVLGFGNEVPFSYPNYSDNPSGLALLPANTSIPRQNGTSWVPETLDSGHIPADQNLITGTLNPGETIGGTWSIWAHPREAEYIEPGIYAFENDIGISKEQFGSDSEWDSITWSLETDITEHSDD